MLHSSASMRSPVYRSVAVPWIRLTLGITRMAAIRGIKGSSSSSLYSWRSTDGALSAGASIISWRGGDSIIKSASGV